MVLTSLIWFIYDASTADEIYLIEQISWMDIYDASTADEIYLIEQLSWMDIYDASTADDRAGSASIYVNHNEYSTSLRTLIQELHVLKNKHPKLHFRRGILGQVRHLLHQQ